MGLFTRQLAKVSLTAEITPIPYGFRSVLVL